MWRRWSMVRQAKLNVLRFIRLHGTPEEIAKGFALGIFIGMTPTFGVQMPIAFCAAWIFRENKLAALLGVWITNPISAPFIYAAEYEFGRLLLGMDRLSLPTEYNFDTLGQLSSNILIPLGVGSLFFAVLFGTISYALAIRFMPYMKTLKIPRWPRRRRKQKQSDEQ